MRHPHRTEAFKGINRLYPLFSLILVFALTACGGSSGESTNSAPVANANGPYSAQTGEAINFSSAGSTDSDGSITTYAWDFGNGTTSSDANPAHIYTAAGSFTVSLTVTDNDGASHTDTTSATVTNPPGGNQTPTANANGPYTGTTGIAVAFSSAGSSDPDGTIATYAWNFGDGNTSNAANPNHTYAAAGTYNVSLTVTDNGGAIDSDVTTATISDPPNVAPTANANGDYAGTAGVAVSFSSAGSSDSDGSIASYAWDFGDGGSSTQANPNHSYTSAGSYTVTLTVTDNDGATDSDTATATISATANVAPTANANGDYTGTTGNPVSFFSTGSSDSDGAITGYQWDFGDGANSTDTNPVHTYAAAGNYTVTLTVTDDEGATDSDTASAAITDTPTVPNVSINSTSQNGALSMTPVTEQALDGQAGYKIFAVNDLGMHCGDFDTRVSSILPPFNVLHATVIQRGATPTVLTRTDNVEVYYSSSSNPNDPILTGVNSAGTGPVYSSIAGGNVFKTNFWDIARDAYDPFYPAGILPAFYPAGPVADILDLGLPMPNVERLYLGDGMLTADQQSMPGRHGPYVDNAVEMFEAYVVDQPFFTNPAFKFGYVSEAVNWYEAPGIPLAAFDDAGRENPWPLFRIQAKQTGTTLASVDTVVPISGEANCGACHGSPLDGGNGSATATLVDNSIAVADVLDDPEHGNVPLEVSKEYAADLNLLRLHDHKHGTTLEANKPVVCQQCHYTPALDLAQLGPLDSTSGGNGREQTSVKSMSNVMHSHHGTVRDTNGDLLFPEMPAAIKDNLGFVSNDAERRAVLDETCYQCHPGRRTDCLRGAMANGGMLCQDCHGNMAQVGDDFSRNVSPTNVGAFELGGDFYTNPAQPRVPWANEPGCGSCHTGDAMNNMASDANVVVNPADADGNLDSIRLFQAYKSNDAKATPIVPTNKRFAENVIEATNPVITDPSDVRIGNPMLYRVSTGHGGIFCETCHGSTHGIWPNKNDLANDNVAANQLQGHKGTIIECDTCHTGSLGNTLEGPHGMHPVGDTSFADGGHASPAENNPNACRACHGDNGQGTVLSRMATDRTLQCDKSTSFCPDGNSVQFPKAHMVGCTECHGNEL
ncbi:MAG: PKD domain-containing protein [Candidatus Thiodiazotropha sp. (ex Myrtea spinifera)]|nr:PKD domain-containing protein [Candidatus Thiodiazotropha sp. (ex Myrtea spinifera)]